MIWYPIIGSSQLNEVLDSIVQGAMEFPDPSVSLLLKITVVTSVLHGIGAENLFWNFKEVIRVLE